MAKAYQSEDGLPTVHNCPLHSCFIQWMTGTKWGIDPAAQWPVWYWESIEKQPEERYSACLGYRVGVVMEPQYAKDLPASIHINANLGKHRLIFNHWTFYGGVEYDNDHKELKILGVNYPQELLTKQVVRVKLPNGDRVNPKEGTRLIPLVDGYAVNTPFVFHEGKFVNESDLYKQFSAGE